jgi:putative membrane protein
MVMSENEKPQVTLNNEQTEAAKIIRDLEILAIVRTRFSSERSLMASMRTTSVSLFTFGFSITKFFNYLENQQQGTQFSEGPYLLGLALICLGILSLVPAVIQHAGRLKRAKELGIPMGMPIITRFSIPICATVVLLVIGFTTFIGILLNWPV